LYPNSYMTQYGYSSNNLKGDEWLYDSWNYHHII
jgi:hypothetical protein